MVDRQQLQIGRSLARRAATDHRDRQRARVGTIPAVGERDRVWRDGPGGRGRGRRARFGSAAGSPASGSPRRRRRPRRPRSRRPPTSRTPRATRPSTSTRSTRTPLRIMRLGRVAAGCEVGVARRHPPAVDVAWSTARRPPQSGVRPRAPRSPVPTRSGARRSARAPCAGTTVRRRPSAQPVAAELRPAVVVIRDARDRDHRVHRRRSTDPLAPLVPPRKLAGGTRRRRGPPTCGRAPPTHRRSWRRRARPAARGCRCPVLLRAAGLVAVGPRSSAPRGPLPPSRRRR